MGHKQALLFFGLSFCYGALQFGGENFLANYQPSKDVALYLALCFPLEALRYRRRTECVQFHDRSPFGWASRSAPPEGGIVVGLDADLFTDEAIEHAHVVVSGAREVCRGRRQNCDVVEAFDHQPQVTERIDVGIGVRLRGLRSRVLW